MFTLAAKLGKSVEEIEKTMTCHEISEWIAYEKTIDEEWRNNYFARKEQEAVNEMSDREVDAMIQGLAMSRIE